MVWWPGVIMGGEGDIASTAVAASWAHTTTPTDSTAVWSLHRGTSKQASRNLQARRPASSHPAASLASAHVQRVLAAGVRLQANWARSIGCSSNCRAAATPIAAPEPANARLARRCSCPFTLAARANSPAAPARTLPPTASGAPDLFCFSHTPSFRPHPQSFVSGAVVAARSCLSPLSSTSRIQAAPSGP